MPVDDQGSVYLTAAIDGDAVAGIAGQMPELAGHPAFWNVYLAVDDVDAATAKVEGAGGKVDAGPFDVMELGRMSAIAGPHRRPRQPVAGRSRPSAPSGPTSPAPRSGTR